MQNFIKKHKLTEEAKQGICKALNIPLNADDETIISAYIEYIDNEPVGQVDAFFAKEMNMCSFESSINKSIDETIKFNKSKLKRHKFKSVVNEDELTM